MTTDLMELDHNELSRRASGANGHSSAVSTALSTRVAAEVQASMVMARQFPRDLDEVYTRALGSCRRRGLAEQAIYSYPRGGTQVEGPSIRLAEELARCMGNMEFGYTELDQTKTHTKVEAYCRDLESNLAQRKTFTVEHIRATKQGRKVLTDPRDIYELVANQAARRVRACILGLVPGDIIERCLEECNKTLQGGDGRSLADRLQSMQIAFRERFGVTLKQLEQRLGHRMAATTEAELVTLRKIFTSLKDDHSKVSDWFESETEESQSDKSQEVQQKAQEQAEKTQQKPKRKKAARNSSKPAESKPEASGSEADSGDDAQQQPGSVGEEPGGSAAGEASQVGAPPVAGGKKGDLFPDDKPDGIVQAFRQQISDAENDKQLLLAENEIEAAYDDAKLNQQQYNALMQQCGKRAEEV